MIFLPMLVGPDMDEVIRGSHRPFLLFVPSGSFANCINFFIHIAIYLWIHLANNYFWKVYWVPELGCNLSNQFYWSWHLSTFAIRRVCLCMRVHVWYFSQICGWARYLSLRMNWVAGLVSPWLRTFYIIWQNLFLEYIEILFTIFVEVIFLWVGEGFL